MQVQLPVTKELYFQQRAKNLVTLPYGPFGEVMNRSILECRMRSIEDGALADLLDSQSPMLPLLLSAHPAFAAARLLPRAKEHLPGGIA